MTTTNYGWYVGNVGGDTNTWGLSQNATAIQQDTTVFDIQNNNISNTAPVIKSAGTMWLNNTSSPYVLNIYDGTQWVTTGTLDPTNHVFTPVGATSSFYIGDYKYSFQTANHGQWILCNGQSLDTTIYGGLFTQIGYTFGGSGANFLVPDARGAVPGVAGLSGLTATGANTPWSAPTTWLPGNYIGEQNHQLITAEMPSHAHTLAVQSTAGGPTGEGFFTGSIGNGIQYGYSLTPRGSNPIVGTTGSDGTHNTMQPTVFVGNFFIFSGV